MKIPKTKKLNKFKNTIKVLVIGLSLVLSIVAPNTKIYAEPQIHEDGFVTVDKTATKVDDTFNRFKIGLDIKTAEAPNIETTVGADIVLVLDVSASMKDNNKMRQARNAAMNFLKNLSDPSGQNRYGVVVFCGDSEVRQPLTANKQNAIDTINRITTGNINRLDGTNIQSGFYRARKMLNDAQSENGIIILLSDGEANRAYDIRTNGDSVISGGYRNTTTNDETLGYNQSNFVITDQGINIKSTKTYGQTVKINDRNYNFSATLMAENEALHAKLDNHTIFTIGFQYNDPGLSRMATPASQGKQYYYQATNNLDAIYELISKTIREEFGTMINNGVVTDPMSEYVDLLDLEDGTYTSSVIGKLEFSQGSVKVETVNGRKKIIWNVGNMAKNSKAHLDYYVALKEEYIDGQLHIANDTTTLKYNDYLDKTTSVNFPIPKVMEEIPIDSAALTVKKVVTNSSDDREFMIRIVGYDITDTNTVIYKTDLLLKNNESVTLENLPFGKYTVSETVPMEYSLTGSDIGYSQETMMNGQEIELIQKVGQNEGYVVLTNNFGHVGFFKASDEKTNYLPAGENIVNTYQVNIDGNVKQTVSKAPQDVILVLDRSGSMNDPMGGNQTRLDVLKTNVINFINKLYEHNPNSRVSIITYSSSSSGTLTSGGFVTLSDNRRYDETWHTYLTKNNGAIKNITATGGTPTDIGLYEARNQLAAATGSNNKSVILFTDGEPGNNGFDTSNYYYINGYRVGAEAINQAEFIKGIGRLTNVNNYISYDDVRYYGSRYDDVTSNRSSSNSNSSGNRNRSGQGLGTKLFVIGINSSNGSQFNDFLTRVASPGHYTKANDSAAMEEAFNSIFTSITSMDTDVAIRLKYDATKFTPIDLQGGTVGGSGINSYIEWTNIIDKETGIFAVKGIKFKNIVANAGQLELSVAGYKNGQETQLANQNVSIVGN